VRDSINSTKIKLLVSNRRPGFAELVWSEEAKKWGKSGTIGKMNRIGITWLDLFSDQLRTLGARAPRDGGVTCTFLSFPQPIFFGRHNLLTLSSLLSLFLIDSKLVYDATRSGLLRGRKTMLK